MLNLVSDTSEEWVRSVESSVEILLLDHTHCEKKAASTAMNLIFRYQRQPALMRPLSELAREELEHFEMMLGILEQRNIAFEPLEPSGYAAALFKHVRRGEPDRLRDTLLACSLIEARSCERMKALSRFLKDPELRAVYSSLLESEARHHHCYVSLAMELTGREESRSRLRELSELEAAIIEEMPSTPRMHH